MWTNPLEADGEDIVEHVASFYEHNSTDTNTLQEYNIPLLLWFRNQDHKNIIQYLGISGHARERETAVYISWGRQLSCDWVDYTVF